MKKILVEFVFWVVIGFVVHDMNYGIEITLSHKKLHESHESFTPSFSGMEDGCTTEFCTEGSKRI